MSFHKAILLCLGFGSVLALAGCGSTAATPGKGDGGNGGSGGGGSGCGTIDYASYKTGDVVSFKTDVLPILAFSCTASECHNTIDKKSGLNLGHKCNYDAKALPWKCVFPTATDPDPRKAQPEDQATVDAVYASLLAPAKTVNHGLVAEGGPPPAGTVLRVVAGDPQHSFLMEKLSDTQNDQGYQCTNQDLSKSKLPCGTFMPLTGDPFCQGTSRPKFDAVARWIQQGAKNN
jgi:hypothetical protein